MTTLPIFDADGHITENEPEIFEHLEAPYNNRTVLGFPLFPTLDGWQRGAVMSRLSKHESIETTPEIWIDFLDDAGIEGSVLYPNAGLGFGLVSDPEWAVVVARAYNDWLYHRFLRVSPRLKGMALVPLQEPAEAVKELRRAVTELGMVGAVLPAVGLKKHLGHADFFPLYQEAEELDCVLSIHGAVAMGIGLEVFDKFAGINALNHPIAQMIQMTGLLLLGGVFDRFPRLRVAFLEAGVGWVPYMMDRLDRGQEVWRRSQRVEYAANLAGKPSEHIRSGRCFFAVEGEETTLPYVAERVGEDVLLFASDFPHEVSRAEIKREIGEFIEREDISERLKRKILSENAKRLYKLA